MVLRIRESHGPSHLPVLLKKGSCHPSILSGRLEHDTDKVGVWLAAPFGRPFLFLAISSIGFRTQDFHSCKAGSTPAVATKQMHNTTVSAEKGFEVGGLARRIEEQKP